jgi:hypothetical protein
MIDTNNHYKDLALIGDQLIEIQISLGKMIGELSRTGADTYHIVHFCKVFLAVNKAVEQIEAPQ